mgnify:CR=1 FL=1
MKINTLHIEKLQNKIFDLLMSNPDVGLGEVNDCRDAAAELVGEWLKELNPKPEKVVYELLERKELQGDVWYYIHKNGSYVGESSTRNLVEAEEMLQKFTSGKPSEPIINVLKTIEIDE